MRRWLPDIWIILGLFLIPLLLFLPVTLGGRTLIPADNLYQDEPWASARETVGVPEVPHNALLSDLVLQNYQWKTFIRQNIRDREIPLWQPNQFAGTTFMANGQHSMLYPFSILYYILPLETAFGWFTVTQLWLAGLWMYVFIRGINLGRMAGFVAALTVQLSSFYITATVHPMIQAGAAWLPLLLLMIEYTIQRRSFPGTGDKPTRLPWTLIGGVALGMPHLAGHIEITYYTLLMIAFYAAGRLIVEWLRDRQWRPLISTGWVLVGMVALGFAIGAVQFIPNVEAANNSFRASRPDSSLETVRGYALPERHVAKFIMPNIYGNPAHHEYFDVFEWETVSLQDTWQQAQPDVTPKTDTELSGLFGYKNYVEGAAYIGILPLVLAAYGVLGGFYARRKREDAPPYRLIFVLLAGVALLLMFGTPFYAILYYGLPGINQLHTPFRWLWPFTISIAILAAFGVDTLRQRHKERDVSIIGRLLLMGGGVTLIGLVASRTFFGQLDGLIERLYTGMAGAQETFPSLEAFYSYQFRNVLLLGLAITGAGLVFLMRRRSFTIRGIPGWQALAVVVIVLDLFAASYDFNPAAKKEWLDYQPPTITWLQQKMEEEGIFRIQAYDVGERPLNANSGWRYGLQDVRGYDSLFSEEYAEMMSQITPQWGLDFNRIVPIPWDTPQALAHPLLDFLNVRYVITDWLIREEDNPAELGFEEVYVDAGVRIYRNVDALPRAYTVPLPTDGTHYQPGEGCESSVEPESPQHLTFIPPPTGTCISHTSAAITQYDNTEVRVDAIVTEASWLVLADSYDAGWRAFIKPKGASDDEEHEIDIHQVNLNLRGVQLDLGEWTVRFKYSPRSFQLGAFVSFISGMLVIFLALIWLWQAFVREGAEADTGKRLAKNSIAPIALNLFNRGIDFAFAFIMLRILGPADAGIYYYAIVIFGWFDIFTNFGLNTLLTRDVSRDQAAAGRYLFNTSLLRLGLASLGIPVLALVLIIRNTTVDPALDSTAIIAIVLLYIGLIPNSISTGLTALFYAFEKAEYPAAMTTISTLVKVSLGLGALLLGWGVVGLAGASILTNFVTFILLTRLAWPLIRDHWEPARDGALQRMMMREAWPLMINHLLATVFFKSDVILMEAINGVAVVGTYSTAYKWLDALNIIPAFFTMALLPIMSRQAHENRDALRRNYILGIKILVMMALPVAVMTTFLATALVGFLGGSEFLPDGAVALQLMIWSIPLGWMNSLTQYVLIALDRQRQITWAFIVAVSFNVIANLIFLPVYSFRAAAITTIFSELVLLIGFAWLIRNLLGNINWIAALWRLWIISGGMLLIVWAVWGRMPILSLLLGPAIYMVGLWVFNPFDSEETQRLLSVLPNGIQRRFARLLKQSPL